MERSLSLTYEETAALLDMSLASSVDSGSEASDSVLGKLGDLYREFVSSDRDLYLMPVSEEFARAA